MADLPLRGADDALYVIDISGWIHRCLHALPPAVSPTGEPCNATGGVIGMLVRLLKDRDPGFLAVAFDRPGRTFRHDLFPGYKAARPARPPELDIQSRRVREIFEAHRIPILESEGFEADDCIAAATARALDAGLRVVIVALDKDLLQLVGDRVVCWDGRSRDATGPAEVTARFGVGPALLGDLLALAGDSSDGIPGVPGVGVKTAATLLQKRGSLADVLRKADWVPQPALRAKLRVHADDARLSRQLVELRADAPIAFDPAELRVGGYDVAKLRAIYGELGFTRLAAEVQSIPKRPWRGSP